MADNNATLDQKSAISQKDIDAIIARKQQLEQEMKAANTEFMLSHYTRLLRAIRPDLEKIAKAQLIQERKQRNEEAKQKREQLKAARKK
jgi:hypothetical protein